MVKSWSEVDGWSTLAFGGCLSGYLVEATENTSLAVLRTISIRQKDLLFNGNASGFLFYDGSVERIAKEFPARAECGVVKKMGLKA